MFLDQSRDFLFSHHLVKDVTRLNDQNRSLGTEPIASRQNNQNFLFQSLFLYFLFQGFFYF